MARSRPAAITTRVERIKVLADDLSRELMRIQSDRPAVSAFAGQIRDDAIAVLRTLKRRTR